MEKNIRGRDAFEVWTSRPDEKIEEKEYENPLRADARPFHYCTCFTRHNIFSLKYFMRTSRAAFLRLELIWEDNIDERNYRGKVFARTNLRFLER